MNSEMAYSIHKGAYTGDLLSSKISKKLVFRMVFLNFVLLCKLLYKF